MIEESFLKSNFIGRDGFRWWIGQIPPIESLGKQYNGEGWGNRVKVRILGYHPYSETELSNNDLPWAQILLSTSDGSGAANYGTNPKIRPGDMVFGFFLDGDSAQIPVISGVFGRTSEVATNQYNVPFSPYTGYTPQVDNDGTRVKVNEQNEQTHQAQKSPYHLPPQIANRINEISYFSGIGDKVYLGTNKSGSKLEKISTELNNAIKFVQDLKSFPNIAKEWIDAKIEDLCEQISKKIEGIVNEIVGGVVDDTYEKIIPALNQGTKSLYKQVKGTVFAATKSVSTAHLAGAKSQEATIKPAQELQKLIPCLISQIIKLLAKIIKDMLCSLLKNVVNFVKCVVDQFLSGLLNSILDAITSGLQTALGALSILLNFSGFNLKSTVKKSAEGIMGIPFSLNCGESLGDSSVKTWSIGSGAGNSPSFDPQSILNLANKASSAVSTASNIKSSSTQSGLQSVVGSLGFLSPNISSPSLRGAVDACYAGPPTSKASPIIDIFGGGGLGATATPIVSGGSIIAALITNGGSNYITPPFIVFEDPSNSGYGAVGRTVIKNGSVIAILIDSGGENYSDTSEGPRQNTVVSEVIIEDPGYNYSQEDTAFDDNGNEYELVINSGSIIKAFPINNLDVTEKPKIRIISSSGSGAKLNPIIGFRNRTKETDNKVVDCIL